MGVHVALERLAGHGRDQLTQHEVPEVRVRGLGTGSEPHTAVAFQQTFDEPGPVRPGLVGRVDPSQRHRVGQTGAVSEQMAGADRSHPLGRSQHRQGGYESITGASRSSRPSSASWTTAVAVTSLVIENQLQTLRDVISS